MCQFENLDVSLDAPFDTNSVLSDRSYHDGLLFEENGQAGWH